MEMRTTVAVYAFCLAFLIAGLTYMIVVGALHR
jgi:hypothetical protein